MYTPLDIFLGFGALLVVILIFIPNEKNERIGKTDHK
jgi:hypothetical protein